MKHNRFERVPIELNIWFIDSNCKYKVYNNKKLNSLRLLKQVNSIYDTREPIVRKKGASALYYIKIWEIPDRHYSRDWKYRSRFPKQYMKNRRR